MRISARCDYACRALLELTLHWPKKEPLQIQTISEKQNIPMRYLVQILLQLKRAGLVTSIRGKEGGYNIAKSPSKIKLGEVMREIGGALLPRAESAETKKSVFTEIWNEVETTMTKVLDGISFEDIAKKEEGIEKAIFYHI